MEWLVRFLDVGHGSHWSHHPVNIRGEKTGRPEDRPPMFNSVYAERFEAATCLLPKWVFSFKHVIDGPHVDLVRGGNLVLVLTTPRTQPDIDCFVVGKLRLVSHFNQSSLCRTPLDLSESQVHRYIL